MGHGHTDQTLPDMPHGLRIYCIGDVHGRLDLLETVTQKIERDLTRDTPDEALIILLGDYIDRGLESCAVVDALAHHRLPSASVCLRGNHEALLEAFLDNPATLEDWRRVGGLETLASYGVDPRDAERGQGYAEARHALMHALPAHHRRFLRGLHLSYDCGPYFFCHAGVRPGIALDQQSPHDLMWIREPFLSSTEDFGRIIIHGHTPVRAPEFHANRINLDTGAVKSGHLTCLVLEGQDQRLL